MTRDEAIAWVINMAEKWVWHSEFCAEPVGSLTVERVKFGQATAALAEPEHVRCQHQAADGSLDCEERAVLCESHGGHDACAAETDRLEAATADLREIVADEHERGYKRARDEIARALEAEARRRLDEYDHNHDDYALNTASGFEAVAAMVRDGTITMWLPKEEK